jgi:hypothetical protein
VTSSGRLSPSALASSQGRQCLGGSRSSCRLRSSAGAEGTSSCCSPSAVVTSDRLEQPASCTGAKMQQHACTVGARQQCAVLPVMTDRKLVHACKVLYQYSMHCHPVTCLLALT